MQRLAGKIAARGVQRTWSLSLSRATCEWCTALVADKSSRASLGSRTTANFWWMSRGRGRKLGRLMTKRAQGNYAIFR
eukprot:125868-Prorocentrum_minimum.AAC.3